MNRVLSFPQSHSCDNPGEAVSKRFCFSCVFSLSFISLIMGYLLGSRQTNVNLTIIKKIPNSHYIDMLRKVHLYDNHPNESVPEHLRMDYNEVLMLREHFQVNSFDQISSIITSEVVLTFKNKHIPDTLEIVIDKGVNNYSSVRNASYTYAIPDEADKIKYFNNSISGLPVYGNFGSEDDFNFLTDRGISLHGCIVLLRLGKTSVIDQVSGALRRGASGVLLFADPQQYLQSDCLSVHEEISPIHLTELQRLRETVNCDSNCGVAVQIIEAMTARTILRAMDSLYIKSPDSWHGALNALYAIGPGFGSNKSWRLVMHSHFISVHYKTYDIAAYLRGAREPDRYIVIANSRRSLKEKAKTFGSTYTLMEVSKALAELKNKKKWTPTRTLLFVSFGFEDTEFSSDSWVQKHIDVIKERTVAFLNLKQPVKGLDFVAAVSPVLENLFTNMSSKVKTPNKRGEPEKNETLFDVWIRKPEPFARNDATLQSCDDSNRTIAEGQILLPKQRVDTAGSEMFSSFGIPTITFGYANHVDLIKTDERVEYIPNIPEYKIAIAELWKRLAFSLAEETILPFNFTTYAVVIENYNEILSGQQKTFQSLTIMNEFDAFNHSAENLTLAITKFQNEIRSVDVKDATRNRIINDKLTHMQRLFTCVLDTYKSLLSLTNYTELTEIEVVRNQLRRGKNCVAELDYFVSSPYY